MDFYVPSRFVAPEHAARPTLLSQSEATRFDVC
jgi:hypothetical protein